jgi:predicted Zn-dependent peptidase
MTVAFPEHALGLPLGGTIAHLERFDVPLLRAHHARHYRATSACLAVVGAIDAERALDSVARRFDDLGPGEPPPTSEPAAMRGPAFEFVRHSSSQTTLRVGFRAPGIRSALEPATDLLLRVIDDGMSTRLYRRICEDQGLCYDVGAAYEAYEDSGLLTLGAETAHERADVVLTELLAIARDLREQGPTQAELDKAKARHRWQLLESLDDSEELAEYVAEQRLVDGVKTLAERRDQIDAVTLSEVRDTAERLFDPAARGTIVVGMQSKKARERLASIARLP